MKIKLSKEYEFEGKKINEIDADLENMSGADSLKAEKIYMQEGNILYGTAEMTQNYAVILLSITAKLPREFFNILRAKDIVNIKNIMMGFLMEEDSESETEE